MHKRVSRSPSPSRTSPRRRTSPPPRPSAFVPKPVPLINPISAFEEEEWPSQRNPPLQGSINRRRWMSAIRMVSQKLRAFQLRRKIQKFSLCLGYDAWLLAIVPSEQITRALERAKLDKNLELPGKGFFELPDQILDFSAHSAKEVKRLVLSENRLSRLPSSLFVLFSGLVNLRLANNRLTYLPNNIGSVQSLQILSVENNRLLLLPESIGNLEALHTFYVNHNSPLHLFPLEFGRLKHLSSKGCLKEVLYDMDRVRYPPREVSAQGLAVACDLMNRMWEASVSGDLNLNGMGLSAIPYYLCLPPLATSITSLSLLQNEITRLPAAVGRLTNLDKLRVDEAGLLFPPQHLVRQSEHLRDPASKALHSAARAPLMAFLAHIDRAVHSRELVLRGGVQEYGGVKVDVMVSVMAEEILELEGCKLMDLSHNAIREMPPLVSRLTALTSLSLDHNRLRYVPHTVSRLTTLQRLSAAHNDLRMLPPDCLAPLLCLIDIDLSHNRLAAVPPSLPACTALTRLSLHHNALTAFPPGMERLCRLRYVYLGSNPMEDLPPQLGASPLLTEFNLDGCNQLLSVSPEVIHGSVPPRCPMPEPHWGASRLLSNPQRLVALLAHDALRAELQAVPIKTILKHAAALPSTSFLRAIIQTHCEMTEATKLEHVCRAERKLVAFDVGELLYTRSWRLSKAGQVGNMDPVVVNQIVAMGMPQMARSPALVRYVWALWSGHCLAVADMSGTGISKICPAVLQMAWLTKLYLQYNRICQLPEQISAFTQLLTLDLGHNLINTLPPVIGSLTTLRELNLCYNMLDSLPKEMANLHHWVYQRDPKAMQHYDTSWIEGNPISFPHVQVLRLGPGHTRGFLKQVAAAEQTGKLDFRQRDLPLFPDQLTEFSFLFDMDLSYNKIDRIPPPFTNMVQLKVCTLAGNSIDRLPTKLNSLTSLEVLDLRDNQLLLLPDSIGALHGNLKKLLLGRNKLNSIPRTIGMLTSLLQLHLNWNQLTELPDEIAGCKGLVELQLSYNKIQQLPSSFSRLTKLTTCALQDNAFLLLPAGLGNMPSLNKLSYANNPWLMPQQEVLAWPSKYIEKEGAAMLSVGMTVWCRFQRLARFRKARIEAIQADGTFDLSYPFDRDAFGGIDKEEHVPRQVIEEDGSVQTLIKPLSAHQRLVDFMNRLCSANNSRELDLIGFHITEFIDFDAPIGLKYILGSGWYVRGLTKLNLAHNRLSTLPVSVSSLLSLTVLNVQNNAIIALPQTLSSLTCLKHVDVSNNYLTVLPSGLGMALELEKIITHHNPLIAPPPEIVRRSVKCLVKYLRGVHLARANGKLDWNDLGLFTIDTLLVMLPDGDATLVTELYLDDNLLVVLHPIVLRELQNLEVLRCCRNYLSTVHPSLAVWCPKLQQITLDANRFAYLPHTIGALSALVAVSFDNNPHLLSPPPEVNMMPSQIKIKYLRQLYDAVEKHIADMSQMDLQETPMALLDVWDVEQVDLSSNKLRRMSPLICFWSAITELSLANNEITSVEVNLGICVTLNHVDLSHNRIRRLPPEMGRLTVLKTLSIATQACSPTMDINGRSQGYMWSTEPEKVKHVHNIAACTPDFYGAETVKSAIPCPRCLQQGSLEPGWFSDGLAEAYVSDTEDISPMDEEGPTDAAKDRLFVCSTCHNSISVQELRSRPMLHCSNIRPWLPSRVLHQLTWSPLLPLTTFRRCYSRVCTARAAADLRPVPNVIETPPIALLEEGDVTERLDNTVHTSCTRIISYLGRCLNARLGELDTCSFSLTQFPLEALDLSGLRICRASDNRIKDLPSDLDRLTNLEVLHLDHNLLEFLPPGIRFMTALKELLLNDNMLTEMCPEVGACTKLARLALHANRLYTLPHTIGNCVLLSEVTLRGNPLYILPPSLSCARQIVTLELDTDPSTNCLTSPPNPIPQQGTYQVMRYLHEMYAYTHEFRLSLPGYELDFVPDLILEASTCVTALNLDQNAITEIPAAIGDFTLLREIFSICDNRLNKLPRQIGELIHLQRLCVSGNFLGIVPQEVSKLTNLIQLALDHNHLTEIPRSLSTLTRLQEFTFVDNKLTRIHPEFGLISSLTKLGIADNPLIVPPREVASRSTAEVVDYLGRIKVSQFTGSLDLANLNLRSLNKQLSEAYGVKILLAQNNSLNGLPDDTKAMTALQELYLDGNPLAAVPDVVGALADLRILSLQHMSGPLQSFGNSVAGLVSLVVLRASNNSIYELPDQFRRLLQLEFVDLCNNHLASLPRSFSCCTQLRVLLLANNSLAELCKGMSGFQMLHTIDVSRNELTHLSRGLGALTLYYSLKNHYLSQNKWEMPPAEICRQGERRMLEYVGELWKSKLGDAVSLVKWRLSVLPMNVLELRNIVDLKLDDNVIEVIPREIQHLKKLQELSIMRNKLKGICEELFNIQGLVMLKLDDNHIAAIPPAIERACKSLTYLSITQNPIRTLPMQFGFLEVIEIFQVNSRILEPDLRWTYEIGLDTLLPYLRMWKSVESSGLVRMSWSSNMPWEAFTKIWKYAERVTLINLNDNVIDHLPQNMCALEALVTLQLERNQIQRLPYSMFRLTRLQTLALAENVLYDPPQEVVDSVHLRQLLGYLEAMYMASEARVLVASSLGLPYWRPHDLLPAVRHDLHRRLYEASFKDTDSVPRRPQLVHELQHRLALIHVEALSLDNNKLESVPEAVALLSGLTLLSLRSNLLASLPDKTMGVLTGLTSLDLDHNHLLDLPPQLEQCAKLKKLSLNQNDLQEFPEVLNMNSNQLELLPPQLAVALGQLRVVQVKGNKLFSLPTNLGNLARLVALHVSDNYLPSLPVSISRCGCLRALFLSNNPLTCIPQGVLALTRLQQLRLGGTLLRGLPPEVCMLTCLVSLQVSDCPCLVWPPPHILSLPLAALLAYLREHYQPEPPLHSRRQREGQEEDKGVYESVSAAAGTPTAVMQLSAAAMALVDSLRSLELEVAQLSKERVKHVRMGNKSNVAAIDARLAALTPARQELGGKLWELQDGQAVEEELVVILAELDRMDAIQLGDSDIPTAPHT